MSLFNTLLLVCMLASVHIATCYKTVYLDNTCTPTSPLYLYLTTSEEASSMIIAATNRSSYAPSRQCNVVFSTTANKKIVASISYVDLRTVKKSCLDSISLSNGTGQPGQPLCSFTRSEGNHLEFISSSEKLYLDYHTDDSCCPDQSGFELTVTSVKISAPGNCPLSDNFLCDNGNCIWKGLTCDGRDNCGDNSDEKNCSKGLTTGQIVGIVMGILGVIVILLIVLFIVYKYKKSDPASQPLVEDQPSKA